MGRRKKLRHLIGLDRENHGKQNICSIIMFLMTTYYTIELGNLALVIPIGHLGNLIFTMRDVGVILYAGLCGTFPATVSVFVAFIYLSIKNSYFTYLSSIYLICALIVGSIVRKGHLTSIKKSLFSSVVITLVVGDLWGILLSLLGIWEFSSKPFINLISYFVGPYPEVILCIFILRLLLCKSPEFLRSIFFMSGFYEKDSDNLRYKKENSKISKRVIGLLLGETGIIIISCIFWVSYLMPSFMLANGLSYNATEQKYEIASTTSDNDMNCEDGRCENTDNNSSDNNSSYNSDSSSLENTDSSLYTCDNCGLTLVTYNMNTEDNTASLENIDYINAPLLKLDLKLFLVIFNIVIPIGILTSHMMNVFVAEPIYKMSNVMRTFYKSNYDHDESKINELSNELHKLNIDTGDELQELYSAMDGAMILAKNSIEQQKKSMKLSEDLRVAKKANETKSAFLSNMSHEIRTPINAILGMDEMIIRQTREPSTHKYALNIQNSGKSLLSLVNDILDFSKIEAGKMDIVAVDYDMASLINDIVNMLKERAINKGLLFNIKINPSLPYMLHGDDIRIKQCIVNILTNAIKYTNEGSVTLSIDYKDNNDISSNEITLLVSIKDTGIGIKEEDLQKLYKPFERIEEERNRTIEGAGLGMNITKHLLNLMGTNLIVHSVYGEGSDFSFELVQKVIRRDPIGDFEKRYEEQTKRSSGYTELFHAPSARILVVDDTEMNLIVIKELLKNTMLTVDTALSGKEALDMVKNISYDVIFIDHRMPDMDGIETLNAMRAPDFSSKSKNAPCIALTANAISGARDMYINAGFEDYLSKPINTLKLENMLIDNIDTSKVHLRGSKEYEEESAKRDEEILNSMSSNGADSQSDVNSLDINSAKALEFASSKLNMDILSAIENCGSFDTFVKAYDNFISSIEFKADEIEKYYNENDISNYMIKVHALKSSARLVGMMDLSNKAKALEDAANEGDTDTIRHNTKAMLALYRSYSNNPSITDSEDLSADNDKELISEEDLNEAYEGIREFVDAFDFKSANNIFNDLSNYRLQNDDIIKYNKIKEALLNADRKMILDIIDNE